MFLFLLLLYACYCQVFAIPSISTSSNQSEVILKCPPAMQFIQTHMAPDFESPQLVRRLDWFHEDSLIASYQQNVVADSSRQWWVAEGRFHLQKPFYALKITQLQPMDAGFYRCRLETDPLFSLSLSSAQMELTVLVRPVPPSSPEVKAVTNRSVTLQWNHNSAKSHKPILRYSVGVRNLLDDHRYIIPAPSNATSVIVDNLNPFTLYSFSIRAENAAGLSDFGPETKQRTRGDAPVLPPVIHSISNSSGGCVQLEVAAPEDIHGDVKGFMIILGKENENPRNEWFPGTPRNGIKLCNLLPNSQYLLSVSVETDFGTSPAAEYPFHTEIGREETLPRDVTVTAKVGVPSLSIRWKVPERMENIIQYNLYHKAEHSTKWIVARLPTQAKSSDVTFKYELNQLKPNTTYRIRVSASSPLGESMKSPEIQKKTDFIAPSPIGLTFLSFDCKNGVHLEWDEPGNKADYRIEIQNETQNLIFNTTQNKLDVIDLSLHSIYLVRVRSSRRSIVDQNAYLVGQYGTMHRFQLNDHCVYESSFCDFPKNENCQRLVQAVSSGRIQYVIAIIAFVLFCSTCILVAFTLKRKCMHVKFLLKKKEKCVYLEELSPLVYDSTGCEDIPVELFYGYCDDLERKSNAKYRIQFEQVEQISKEDEKDESDGNLDKDRYLNIGAMESSRVRLHSSNSSDYINANYIDSCEKQNAYIATQAPLPSTFSDFWSMIWQERSNIVVMITNMIEDGRRKCDQYWPSVVGQPQTHGSYQITLVQETINAHFIHRILSIRITKCVPQAERRIHQLHFTGWPDHGVPDSAFPLLSFINYASDIQSTGPIVVHCSAGVGRSGSYILIDSMRRHLINFRKLNMMGHLIHMRRQRSKLVQTVEQYMLCHQAVRQLIRHGITRVHTDLFQRYIHYLAEENVNGKTRMQMQYEDICDCTHRPKCPPPQNPVILPGYHRLDEFIVANWSCETEQLWELVWSKNCQTVVLIGDESYWSGLESVGEMSVQHGENFVLLQNKEDQLCVRVVMVQRERLEENFWNELERIQKERLAYHEAPLMILNPPFMQSNGFVEQLQNYFPHETADALSNSEPTGSPVSLYPAESASLAYILCALTALACQMETQSCIDVVEILASYKRICCGIWSSRADIEFIYSRLSILIGGSRV